MSSDGSKKQFWKRNTAKVPGSIQHVYGAQHPPFDPLLHANLIKAGNKPPATSTPGKPKKATTFQEFESITSDAWDVGDDDDELLAMAAQNLNIEVVMETANKVIENHSKQQERRQQQLDEPPGPEEKYEEEGHGKNEEERLEEEETTTELSFSSERLHHGDNRLVKSHSEAPIGSPKEMSSERAALYRQQSLPHRPLIPLVARMADQNTSGTPAMTEREASRLDKFRQLVAGPNTDLGNKYEGFHISLKQNSVRMKNWYCKSCHVEQEEHAGIEPETVRGAMGLVQLEMGHDSCECERSEELRKLSWSGIPRQVRPITWKLLSVSVHWTDIVELIPSKCGVASVLVNPSKCGVASVLVSPSKCGVASVLVSPSKCGVASVLVSPSKCGVASVLVSPSKCGVASVLVSPSKCGVASVLVSPSKCGVASVLVSPSKCGVASVLVSPSKCGVASVLGYLPANAERRASTLQRKRQEYFGFIEQYYDSRNDEHHQDTYRQIHIDIPRMSPETLVLQPRVTEFTARQASPSSTSFTSLSICNGCSESIHIDIPRTNPLIPLFQQASVQERQHLVAPPLFHSISKAIFERILFIWAIRHPASGYVQGINDLVTPFFVVYIFEYIATEDCHNAPVRHEPSMWFIHEGFRSMLLALDKKEGKSHAAQDLSAEEEVENFDVSSLQEEVLRNIEADSFWCMSKLLDGIQDNYTFAQPGIQRKVKALEELVSRIDETVHRHMQHYEVEYLQFAFRWMNNLLMRELPLRCTIRLWDTYQAEPEGFSHFHLYVCAAFLVHWRKEILEEKDFQKVRAPQSLESFSWQHIQIHVNCIYLQCGVCGGLMILLQNLPTMHWGNEEVSVLLAEAYRLKFAFADAPNHYKR
ncbi:hypothetical protein QTP70_033298 [Hemibagrus guttatus]|uniref:Rab-GAP TBC domain-containing protein n=2 Tax=Siluroidei TaxID=1489793 RepID=A0AAE0UUD5_9TELE|nr:hypothetical protein QTP70_033298 [Hemibagrus guttatus]